jgi:hypothetical protein
MLTKHTQYIINYKGNHSIRDNLFLTLDSIYGATLS